MGREIRRVPEGWEHPRNTRGHHQPMMDVTYEDALKDWQNEREDWLKDDALRQEAAEKYDCHTFEDWHGTAPDPDYHRPSFDGKATCYQVYETVTEGTPVSPVFAETDSLLEWLVGEGYSRHAAETFVEEEWAPSMMFTVTEEGIANVAMNMHVFDQREYQAAETTEAPAP